MNHTEQGASEPPPGEGSVHDRRPQAHESLLRPGLPRAWSRSGVHASSTGRPRFTGSLRTSPEPGGGYEQNPKTRGYRFPESGAAALLTSCPAISSSFEVTLSRIQ